MMEKGDGVSGCDFCNVNGQALQGSKTLPCGHTCCHSCLQDTLDADGVTTPCLKCQPAVSTKPTEMSASPVEQENYCDICRQRKQGNVLAVSYCMHDTCEKKYCDKHKQFHNEVLTDHRMIDITEFNNLHSKSSKRSCPQHDNQPLTDMGCRKCGLSLCAQCIDGNSGCGGLPHHVTTLKTLANEVEGKADELRKKITDRQDELSALCQESDRILAEYDDETETMIQLINKTKDEQVQTIGEKYRELESRVTSLRQGPREEILKFKEVSIQARLSTLHTSMETLDSATQQSHQADFAGKFRDTENKIKPLLDEGLPTLTVSKPITRLCSKGECRNIELYSVQGRNAPGIMLAKSVANQNVSNGTSAGGDGEASTSQQAIEGNEADEGGQVLAKKRKRDTDVVVSHEASRHNLHASQSAQLVRPLMQSMAYLPNSPSAVTFSRSTNHHAIRYTHQPSQSHHYTHVSAQHVRYSLQGVNIHARGHNYPPFAPRYGRRP